jgi:Ca-activated chloride channel family protein
VYARIRIGTRTLSQQPRGPVNVALAIDTSGSMEGAPIQAARRASLQMIDALKDGDRLAVIAFHTKTEVLLSSTELSDDVRTDVKRRISEIKAFGTTELGGGLSSAVQEVRSYLDRKGINRVVLLGDGIPNTPSMVEPIAREAAESGITITTLGLGLDYDETLMGKIAEISGGRFRYIESADKVAGFFLEELYRLDTAYARHVSAVFTPGPGVRIDAVVGAENPPDSSGRVHMRLSDIAQGDSRDIMVRLTVTPRKAGVPIELLDVAITFDDALENAGRLERNVYFGAHTSDDEAKIAKARKPDVELSAALAEASATTIVALELAKQGSYVRARDLLTKGAEAAAAQTKRTPSAALEKHATDMVGVAKDMPAVDRPTASQAAPAEGSEYEFSDDASPMPAPKSPAAVRKQKEVHQQAYEALH